MNYLDSTYESDTLPHLDSLYRVALRMVADPSAAGKCVGQAYVEASRSCRVLDRSADHRISLFAALFRILHHRHKVWFPGHRTVRDLHHDEILLAFDNIPTIYREIVLLADVEGFNKSEIQTILGVPTETVTARLAEGRSRLRNGMSQSARATQVV